MTLIYDSLWDYRSNDHERVYRRFIQLPWTRCIPNGQSLNVLDKLSYLLEQRRLHTVCLFQTWMETRSPLVEIDRIDREPERVIDSAQRNNEPRWREHLTYPYWEATTKIEYVFSMFPIVFFNQIRHTLSKL